MEEWQRHENHIAKLYGGKRTKGSGSGVKQKGDVRITSQGDLVECKARDTRGITPGIVSQLEKVAREAYEEGLDPALALRYYLPDSILADSDGYVDMMVRLVRDDTRRD
jgi:hypothetical protein